MSKYVLFSDMHCHIFRDFAKPDDEYINDRFRAQMETLQKVFDIAREHAATLIFAGDLFHSRSRLEDVVFNNVYSVFATNRDIPTILVRGNHDSKQNTTDTEHWLKTFDYLDHVVVLDEPDSMALDGKTDLYAIPYSDDVDYLKECIVNFSVNVEDTDKKSILVAHVGVDGSETGKNSHRLEGAFTVQDMKPDVFDYVALGHYHKRQFLDNRDNIFYIGNTIQTSFSDEGQDKGVFLIDTEKEGKPEFIPIQNKKFITLTEVNEETQEIVDNNYVRFVVPQEQAKDIEVFKEESDNVRVEVQREYRTESRIDVQVDSSEKDIVQAYAKKYHPKSEKLALEVLNEAMNEGGY